MHYSRSLCAMFAILAAGVCLPAWASPEVGSVLVPAEDLQMTPASADTALTDPNKPEKCGYMECLPLVALKDDVYYTVQTRLPAFLQASKWGIPANVLVALNSSLSYDTMLEPGTKLLVDARMPSSPVPYSRGKCNRGRISNARILPEGEGYFLRTTRPHSWGTDDTIQALMTLFHEYHLAYPDAPPINVGDISKRRGGKIKPHKSHQSGRDVDLGFVHTVPPDEHHPENFIRASASNLDVEKTWFVIQTLVRTGLVKIIYVDRVVMKYLWQYAAPNLTPAQRELFFSNPRHSNSSSSILQHWPGHKNHLHVRFKCPKDQIGCR